MWWIKNKSKENNSEPKCPVCVTHPVLVASGYEDKKSLKCPVCKALFNRLGLKYDPDAEKVKDPGKGPSLEDEVMQEQQELWEYF